MLFELYDMQYKTIDNFFDLLTDPILDNFNENLKLNLLTDDSLRKILPIHLKNMIETSFDALKKELNAFIENHFQYKIDEVKDTKNCDYKTLKNIIITECEDFFYMMLDKFLFENNFIIASSFTNIVTENFMHDFEKTKIFLSIFIPLDLSKMAGYINAANLEQFIGIFYESNTIDTNLFRYSKILIYERLLSMLEAIYINHSVYKTDEKFWNNMINILKNYFSNIDFTVSKTDSEIYYQELATDSDMIECLSFFNSISEFQNELFFA